MLVHDENTLLLTSKLMAAIYDSENWYLVHVDSKYASVRSDLLESMLALGPNVDWGQVFDVRWARWSMIEPTLWAMVRLLPKPWEVFINLSGDSWPVLQPISLRRWLAATAPHNLVTSGPSCPTGLRPTARSEFGDGWHKKQAYPQPMVEGTDLEAYYGSQWMVLRRDFVEFLVRQLELKDTMASKLRDWFVGGWVEVEGVGLVKPHIPDETFFPSLLAYHNFSLPDPVLVLRSGLVVSAAFYIRMDEHYPWSSSRQHYTSTDLDRKERPWGPYYLGVYDLADIRASGAIFIRKTSPQVDANIYDILPVNAHADVPPITWPSHARLAMSVANPYIGTVSRGSETHCVRVAESIHCPPEHHFRPDVRKAKAYAVRRILAVHPELEDNSTDKELDDLILALAKQQSGKSFSQRIERSTTDELR